MDGELWLGGESAWVISCGRDDVRAWSGQCWAADVKRTVLRAVRCSVQCCGLRFPPNAWPRWCFVRELHDGIGNPAPGRRAVVIAVGRELVGADGSLLERFLAVALEHQ